MEMLAVLEDSLDGLELFEHLLVVAAALIGVARPDALAHHLMNLFALLVGDGEGEEVPFLVDELEVLALLDLIPVVIRVGFTVFRQFFFPQPFFYIYGWLRLPFVEDVFGNVGFKQNIAVLNLHVLYLHFL
jgi:hypothetical protein